MNILPVTITQDVPESQYQKARREQLNTSSSHKEVSTLLVVSATIKKSISKHAKISEFNLSTQVHHEDIRLETRNNTSCSHYGFIYRIICIKKFEWKCDQLFQ